MSAHLVGKVIGVVTVERPYWPAAVAIALAVVLNGLQVVRGSGK